MSEKLVWNAISNFLNRARKAGNKSDEISRKACEFFTKDDIIKAKCQLKKVPNTILTKC